jgi:hypothetical protein
MFLLEDGNGAVNSRSLDRPRKGQRLIAVLFSAVIIFYLVLSLLSAHNAAAATQAGQSETAAVGSVISTSR